MSIDFDIFKRKKFIPFSEYLEDNVGHMAIMYAFGNLFEMSM